MSKTILSHLSKTGLDSSGNFFFQKSLYNPNMLEKIAFRIGDLIHHMEYNIIVAADPEATALASLLSIIERVPWVQYDGSNSYFISNEEDEPFATNALVISLVCKDKAKKEIEITKTIKVAGIVYLVNTEANVEELFGNSTRIIYLTTLTSIQSFLTHRR